MKVGDKVLYAGSEYEVADIDEFNGFMVGIYDEPPSFHIDYIRKDSVKLVTKKEE